MRRLICVQIVHSVADLGTLAEEVRARYSEEGWHKHVAEVEVFWQKVRQAVVGLALDWTKVKLYQDGLPVGGEAAKKLVEELASRGSPNYQLLKELMERGATLIQTEDPELLKQEYARLQQSLAAGVLTAETQRTHRTKRDALLEARDAYIARQIDETLQDDEVGILFLGALHNVLLHLPKDIAVTELSITSCL